MRLNFCRFWYNFALFGYAKSLSAFNSAGRKRKNRSCMLQLRFLRIFDYYVPEVKQPER